MKCEFCEGTGQPPDVRFRDGMPPSALVLAHTSRLCELWQSGLGDLVSLSIKDGKVKGWTGDAVRGRFVNADTMRTKDGHKLTALSWRPVTQTFDPVPWITLECASVRALAREDAKTKKRPRRTLRELANLVGWKDVATRDPRLRRLAWAYATQEPAADEAATIPRPVLRALQQRVADRLAEQVAAAPEQMLRLLFTRHPIDAGVPYIVTNEQQQSSALGLLNGVLVEKDGDVGALIIDAEMDENGNPIAILRIRIR